MTDEPENLVLHWMRRIDEKLDNLAGDMRDVKARTTMVKRQVGEFHVQLGELHVAIAGTNARIDRVDMRLERIERRLDLVESPAK